MPGSTENTIARRPSDAVSTTSSEGNAFVAAVLRDTIITQHNNCWFTTLIAATFC